MPDRSKAFVPENLGAVARAACRQVGLPDGDVQFLRLGQNILYHVPEVRAVVRIARDSSYSADAAKEVAVATWLAEEDVPTVQLFDVDCAQPICCHGYPVTFWRYLPGREPSGAEVSILGEILRNFHRLTVPEGIPIPKLNPLDRVTDRIERAPIPEPDKEFLAQTKEDLSVKLRELNYELPVGVNHGDVHIKNVIISPEGMGTLIDFEAVNIAHHEWDLAKTATEAAMGMLPADAYSRFSDSYGYDLTSWEGFPTICSTTQLRMVTWLAQNVGHNEKVANEYRKRMQTLRHGFTEAWSGF
ncbi:phosphotransferase enzyme family protein [Nocardia fusca]|uniref:phosphotransferase enzyme family protein n=1 Tax=Nocardia fusca TaxID=941183 RepID=UPI0037A38B8C